MFIMNQFNFSNKSRLMYQDKSALNDFRFEKMKGGNRGIVIYSHKTLRKVDFVIFKVDSNDSGIAGWWLRPSVDDIKKDKSLEGLQLLIMNK